MTITLNTHENGTPMFSDPAKAARSSAVAFLDAIRVPEWTRDAPCAHIDPEIFFPRRANSIRDRERAQQVCATCPVLAMCEIATLAELERSRSIRGVWAGVYFGSSNRAEDHDAAEDALRARIAARGTTTNATTAA